MVTLDEKIRGSPKSIGFVLWETLMFVPNFVLIRLCGLHNPTLSSLKAKHIYSAVYLCLVPQQLLHNTHFWTLILPNQDTIGASQFRVSRGLSYFKAPSNAAFFCPNLSQPVCQLQSSDPHQLIN